MKEQLFGKALQKGDRNLHTYEYDSNVYFRKITVTACFCVFILAYAVFQLAAGETPFLWIGALVIAGYFVWETFVSIANPSNVEAVEKGITFSAYKKSHHYDWTEIRKFRCKPLASGTKMYVRINEAGMFRGRYWVNCYYYSEGEELFKFLYNKEIEIDPNGLKAKAVQGSIQSKKLKKQKYDRKQQARAQKQLAKQLRANAAKKR